jgi:hypothetical protein
MTELQWGQTGDKRFETGVSKGVLYRRDGGGQYNLPYAWNGLTAVNESPSGAESNKQYADNVEYANLLSAEQYAATIEAFTYPDEFEYCDGTASLAPGITVGQQKREVFGFSYQTIVGSDLDPELGYKIHLVYGCQAAPSEKNHATVNDSPELSAFSWEVSTTPVPVPGLRPSATLTIDSTKTAADDLAALEGLIYGTAGADARLPLPAEIISLVGAATEVLPQAPTYNSATDTITIPGTAGVIYQIDGETVAAGPVVITKDTIVTATPASGYKFPAVSDTDWFFDWS